MNSRYLQSGVGLALVVGMAWCSFVRGMDCTDGAQPLFEEKERPAKRTRIDEPVPEALSLVRQPYGARDPYALVALIASTQVHGQKFSADQMPSLSARVSHGQDGKTGTNPAGDRKLMKFLADHQHMTPFEHQSATFKVVLPLFVARHWQRHRTQSYNEISMRYSEDPVGKFYVPQEWRKQGRTNHQSGEGRVEEQEECTEILQRCYRGSLEAYRQLIAKGVCREQARLVVPVGNYTEFYATANLRNWAHWYQLRIAEDAQWEIRQYACCVDELLSALWPNSWGVLKAQGMRRTR